MKRVVVFVLGFILFLNGTLMAEAKDNVSENTSMTEAMAVIAADTPEIAVESLATAVTNLTKEVGLDPNFAAMGIAEEDWNAELERMAVLAYEDQCSPANPRVPLVEDMKEILRKAYKGN